jgi:hypothetical protein
VSELYGEGGGQEEESKVTVAATAATTEQKRELPSVSSITHLPSVGFCSRQ